MNLLHRARHLPIFAAEQEPTTAPDLDAVKPVFALIGDSITAGCTPTSSGDTNVGYWHWAQAISGFRAYCPVYAGIGGNVTSQVLGRLETDVIIPMAAYTDRDRYCIVMAGVNDSVNASDIITAATDNLTQIYNDLIAAGITPIAMTITPTIYANDATKLANWTGINDWLRVYCPANGITLVDNIDECLDGAYPPTAPPTWKTDYSHDGVHPTAQGALAIGAPLAATLAALLPAVDHFEAGTAAFTGSLLSNHAMLGTGGSLGTDGSGTVADSWQILYGVGSKAARSDGIAGEWQVLEIGASSVRFNPSLGIDVTSGFVPGDKVAAQAEVYCVDDWDTITQLVLHMEFRSGSSSLDVLSFLANNPNTGEIVNPAPDDTITLRTAPAIVPAGTTAIRTYLYFVGAGGTIRVGRYELNKVGA